MARNSKVGKRCDAFSIEPFALYDEEGTNMLQRPDGTPVTYEGWSERAGRNYRNYVYKVISYHTLTCPLCEAVCRYAEDGTQECEEKCGGFIDHEPIDYSKSSAGRFP